MHPVTTAQMRLIEQEAIDTYHIPEIIMMENAGRAVAEYADKLLKKINKSDVVIICGSGNNGGDGLVAARHLHNKGKNTRILLSKPKDSFKGLSSAHLEIIEKMGLPVDHQRFDDINNCLLIDALLGTGLKGDVGGSYHGIIDTINESGSTVLSVDIPSGLDADTGKPLGTAVKACATITMAAPKAGMLKLHAKQYTGTIVTADIGIPKGLLK